MAKPKAKSLQQKLGFFDDDLKSPDHDSILKWLDKNIDVVLNTIYNFREWNKNHVKELQEKALSLKESEEERLSELIKEKETELKKEQKSLKENKERLRIQLEEEKEQEDSTFKSSSWTKERIETNSEKISELKEEIPQLKESLNSIKSFDGLQTSDLPQRNKPRVLSIKWEYTVTNQSYNPRTGYQSTKSVIGFIDMKVDFAYTKLFIDGLDENGRPTSNMTWGQTERKYENDYDKEILFRSLLIEVKTKIPSLGELFRQLNTYREYEKGDFLVVCPDDSEKETINNQGFMFYKF